MNYDKVLMFENGQADVQAETAKQELKEEF